MTATFLILAILAGAGTAGAMGLRNAVHCVLALTVGFAALAALYLQLGAQFVGFTQIMVYVGAVAILAVFAIMMTHHPGLIEAPFSRNWLWGAAIAAAVFATLARAISLGTASAPSAPPEPAATVQQIGNALMHRYILPLEIVGLLLTAALIGAVVIAMDPPKDSVDEIVHAQERPE
jgi:NADH-quinone oxidoreductase subunit J